MDEGDETTARVRTAFERVVRLLPGDTLLNPPATAERLAAAEEHLGHRLPDDVRALYRLADGQVQYEHPDLLQAAGLIGGEPFLPLARVLLHWDQWAGFEGDTGLDEFASSTPEGFVRPATRCGGGSR